MRSKLTTGINLMLICSVLAYPLLAHLGTTQFHQILAIIALQCICILLGLQILINGNGWGWLPLSMGLLLMLLQVTGQLNSDVLIKTLPPLIYLGLGLLFGLSLSPQRIPLITGFARICEAKPLDTEALEYTRRLTGFWMLLFIALSIESALLALFASDTIWSLFTNFINYILMALVFVVEYRYRVRRLPQMNHPGLIEFIKSLKGFRLEELLKTK